MAEEQQEPSRRDAIIREFEAAALKHGLILDGPPDDDGEFHRVPVKGDKPGKTGGSYRLSLEGTPRGFIQNFREGGGVNWRPGEALAASFTLTPEERTADTQRQHERMAGRLAKQEERAEWMSREWATLRVAPDDHGYLVRKGVINHGLKLDRHGNLVMPLRDIDDKLWSVQRISPDGNKLFTKDGRTLACFSRVGADNPAAPIVIAEGFATSASLYEITGLPVVCALNAGNLKPVAEAFRAKFPDRPILIAGDNDHVKEAEGKRNVGREVSIETAAIVGGRVLMPQFEADNGGTDWNDLAKSRGADAVRAQVEAVLVPLGIALGAPQGFDARTYLAVPFKEKDEAHGLGASFDRDRKQWYVAPGVDLTPFARWPRAEPTTPVTAAEPVAPGASGPHSDAIAATPAASATGTVAEPLATAAVVQAGSAAAVIPPTAQVPPSPPQDARIGRAFREALQAITTSTDLKGAEVTQILALDAKVEAVHREAWRRTGNAGAGDRAIGEMMRTGSGFAAEPLPPMAAAALERIRAEFGLAAVAPVEAPVVVPAQEQTEPGWVASQQQYWRQLSDQRGMTGQIEAEFASGKTLAQVQSTLGDKLAFLAADERTSFVSFVRLSLGIPSRISQEGQSEFDAWKRSYDERQVTRLEPAQDVDDDSGPTMWDVAEEASPASVPVATPGDIAAVPVPELPASERPMPDAWTRARPPEALAYAGTAGLFEELGIARSTPVPLAVSLSDFERRLRDALKGDEAPLGAATHARAVDWLDWVVANPDSEIRNNALRVALALGRHDDVFGTPDSGNPFGESRLAGIYHLGRAREPVVPADSTPDTPASRQRFTPMFDMLDVDGSPQQPLADVLRAIASRVTPDARTAPLDAAAREQVGAWVTWTQRSMKDPEIRDLTLDVARAMGRHDNSHFVNDVPFRDASLIDAYRQGWDSVIWTSDGWSMLKPGQTPLPQESRPMPGLREQPEPRWQRWQEGDPAPGQTIGDTPVAEVPVRTRPPANEADAKNPANEPHKPVGEPVAEADLARVQSVRTAETADVRAALSEAKAQQQSVQEGATERDATLQARLRSRPFGTPPAAAGTTADRGAAAKPDREPNVIQIGEVVDRKPVLTATGYEVPESIATRYVVKDGQFWRPNLKDTSAAGTRVPHFEDKGVRLSSHANDRSTLADMVAIAQAKNWTSITVMGSDAFRRNAWLEASLAGVEVAGFKPLDSDHALLEAAKREQARQREALTIRKGEAPQGAGVDTREATAPASSASEKPVASPASPSVHPEAVAIPAPANHTPPLTIAQMREQLAKALSGLPVRTREEVLKRFDARMHTAVEIGKRVATGELKPDQAGAEIDARFAALKGEWSAPATKQTPAPQAVNAPKMGV
ncbi:LPD7 domain-containing protein [Paraburkholderia megapolitana]|uniref:LPD7 domain-containing protein n=1 Tax=Paraburkholderia megapolitana TaxID=420953 RepID=UPI0038BCCAAC